MTAIVSRNSPRSIRTGLSSVAAVLAAVACAKAPEPAASAASEAPSFMFVQVAEDLSADTTALTLRLRNVSGQIIYFSDRPNRIAGHITMPEYLREWTPADGADNFSTDPPNATLSVYQPGQPDNSVAIVEISNPRLDGADLVYTYKLIEGSVPLGGGATALFIDKVGAGGGVGAGYHGVGVGARGPGAL